ncbi:kelch-like protein 38 [Saccostrea cucullata]|uniref:kelch-like protein 38 n=1 Tax=Saccostrea cuccullata TaxID=36930 RepID=UPI002ED31882
MTSPPETEIVKINNMADKRNYDEKNDDESNDDKSSDDESNDEELLDLNFPKTDVTLVVEGKKIHANKAALSQHSPMFKAMFCGNFKESTQEEVPLRDKKYQDVVEFLQCFYPNMKHEVTEQNVLKILPLAHEYQSPLVDDCEKLLISMCKPGTSLTVTSLLDYIIAAEKYGLEKLLDAAMKFCARVDYGLLNGKIFNRSYDYERGKYQYKPTVDKRISEKFKNIDPKHQHTIAEKRLHFLEMNKRRKSNKDPVTADYNLMLSD